MRKILSILALMVAMLAGGAGAANAEAGPNDNCLTDPTGCVMAEDGSLVNAGFYGDVEPEEAATDLPPCEFEDSANCYWDASQRGNGAGDSFTDLDGVAYYWDATPVVQPTADDGAAWDLWDTTGAADLLPNAETVVTYAGDYDGHALTAAEIAVWDGLGNAYLFTIS